MHVEEHRDFKSLVTTEERVAFVSGWYAALKAESPATHLQQLRAKISKVLSQAEPYHMYTGETGYRVTKSQYEELLKLSAV